MSIKPFFSTSILAAAAITSLLAFGAASSAQADSVQFGVTIGDDHGPGPGPDDWRWRHPHPPGPPGPPRPHYWGGYDDEPPPPPPPRFGMSCGEASNLVRDAGYHGVRPTDCSPPVYSFEGWRRGRMFDIEVSRQGRILRVDPAY